MLSYWRQCLDKTGEIPDVSCATASDFLHPTVCFYCVTGKLSWFDAAESGLPFFWLTILVCVVVIGEL